MEVGCGTGKNSRHLSEIGRALVCVDVSAEMLVRHPRRWPNTECYKLDVRDAAAWRVPPLVDGGFDLVVCSLVLEHLNHEAMTQLFERIDQKLSPRAWVPVALLEGRIATALGENLEAIRDYVAAQPDCEVGDECAL